MTILAGDLNIDKFWATAAQELPTTMIATETKELPSVESVVRLLTERRLRIAAPQAGFRGYPFSLEDRLASQMSGLLHRQQLVTQTDI